MPKKEKINPEFSKEELKRIGKCVKLCFKVSMFVVIALVLAENLIGIS